MRTIKAPKRERGAITIFIALTMLVLITVMVTTAFRLSTTNMTAVGNVQIRKQALAAAKLEIEKVVGSPFTEDPSAAVNNAIDVDIDNDDIADFVVAVEEPICERAVPANSTSSSSVTLPGFNPGSTYHTTWRIRATASEAVSGASVALIHRVRVLLDRVDRDAVCPDIS